MNKKLKETLMNAVVSGTVKNVQTLLKEHKLELDDSYFDYKLLEAALLRKVQGIVKLLLKHGCRAKNPHKSEPKESLLDIASRGIPSYADDEIVICYANQIIKKLIHNGASLYDKNLYGEKPIQAAYKKGQIKAVQALLWNYEPNSKQPLNKDDLLYFHMACVVNANCHIIEKYVKCGFDPNTPLSLDSKKYDGLTPIQFAIKVESSELLAKLLYCGADINMKDSSGNTAVSKVLEWEKGERWMIRLYGKLFTIIFCHVQKLFALGLPVSKEVQKGCIQLYPRYQREYKNYEDSDLHSLENVFDDCIKELDKMKSIKIDCYTSLYDILLKDSHELTKYKNNSNLNKAVKEQSMCKFPLYRFLLRLQYHRGSTRYEVLQSAESALLSVLNVHLPDLCSNLILKYLTNEEVSNLKKAAPEKRNLKRKLRGDNQNQVEPASKLQKK